MTDRVPRTARSDIIAGSVLAIVAAYTAFVSVGYGLEDEQGRTGPGLFPLVVAVLLGALALALIVRSASHVSEPAQPSAETVHDAAPADDAPDRSPWVVLSILTALVISVALIPVIGFSVSSAALVLLCMFAIERQSLATSAAFSVVTGVTAWIVFEQILDVPLPGWSG